MWNVKSPNTGASYESAARWFRLLLHWQTMCAQNTPQPLKFDLTLRFGPAESHIVLSQVKQMFLFWLFFLSPSVSSKRNKFLPQFNGDFSKFAVSTVCCVYVCVSAYVFVLVCVCVNFHLAK